MSTVLIVDDKPENLYLLQALLAGNGLAAVTASDGAQALELARGSAPDAVVSDILMPGMDGFALCREWKQDPSLRHIPFIFYTATYTDSRDEKLALDMGADRFLVKPLESNLLLGEIQAVLEAASVAGTPAQSPRKEEAVVMRQYNQALVRKLETKLAELEIALRQRDENERRNAQYARIVTNSRDAMALVSQGYVYLEVNPAYAALVNRPADKIVGYTMSDVLGEESFRRTAKVYMDQCLAGDVTHFETSHDVIGADSRHIAATYSPCRTPGGEITAIAVNITDITDRKRAEEALRASEEKYRAMVDNVGIGVSLISPDMEILERNQQMRAWFPLTDSATRPFGYQVFNLPPRDKISDDWPTRRTLQDGAVHETRTNTSHAGGVRNYRIVSSPVRDAENKVVAAIEMVEDITERLSLEAQLRQAQKLEAVGQLAGGVAHDFNNLLTGVMGYVELCRDALEPDHPIREWLDEIACDAQRSASLTRQLLAFARRQAIMPKVLDLNDTVASMRKLLRRLIGEDIELSWIPAADLWPVRLDPSQIDQILANLCVNARDAIGGVGKVTIKTENMILDDVYCASHAEAVSGAYVMLAVSDTGCGMDRSTLEHIFEPFFTTKEVGQGTGLGLATVHGIVKQNQGHINVYSEPDNGTTFRIYLPRFEGETSEVEQAGAAAPHPGGNETILLVEDEKSIRITTALFLKTLGYTVLTAEEPAQALSLAANHAGRIHLLVTDVIMPGISGRDLAIRLHEDSPSVRCLFMSGYTADVVVHRGILAEGVDFLSKPFTRDVLARKVREVLDRD